MLNVKTIMIILFIIGVLIKVIGKSYNNYRYQNKDINTITQIMNGHTIDRIASIPLLIAIIIFIYLLFKAI